MTGPISQACAGGVAAASESAIGTAESSDTSSIAAIVVARMKRLLSREAKRSAIPAREATRKSPLIAHGRFRDAERARHRLAISLVNAVGRSLADVAAAAAQ